MKLTSVLPVTALAVLLSACGPQAPASPESAASAAADTTVSAPAATVAANADAAAETASGKAIYSRSCSICHATGTAGAPKPGDIADWEPRLAQGMDVLYKHAIEGFSGSKGVMPARGGAANLSDEEVKASVDFMLGTTG
ncbi:MAG: c-type cytochrome [Gammaproteobacteria bacterium]